MVVTSQDNHTTPVTASSGAAGAVAATAAPATSAAGRRTSRRAGRTVPTRSRAARRRDLPFALLFILPAVAGFAIFYAYPTFRGVYLSFTDFHVLTPPAWTGLANFRGLVHDGVFWHSLWVTVYFVLLSVAFGNPSDYASDIDRITV